MSGSCQQQSSGRAQPTTMVSARWCSSRFGTSFDSPAASTRSSPNTRPAPPERRSHRLRGTRPVPRSQPRKVDMRLRVPCPNTASAQFVAPDDRHKGLTKCWHRLTRPRSAKLRSRPNETTRGVSRSDACRSLALPAVCSGELRPLALVVALPAAPSGEPRPSAPLADRLSHPPQAIPSLA